METKTYSTEDFAGFAEYFNDVISPEKAIELLKEMNFDYMEQSLYISEIENKKPVEIDLSVSENIFNQIYTLSEIIDLIKGLK